MTDPKKDVDDAVDGVEETVKKNDPTRPHTNDDPGSSPPPTKPTKPGGVGGNP